MKIDLAFFAFQNSFLGRNVRSTLQATLVAYIERTAPSRYRSILVPSYAFGAKRAILDHGYLASLHNPKVKLVKSQRLTVVGANQIADENGVLYPADICILANGFMTARLLSPMTITGMSGLNLRDLWERGPDGARAYMGCVSRIILYPSLHKGSEQSITDRP
jgi:cation diffusion facilitator CzcD-associated flavoprotein CzcO